MRHAIRLIFLCTTALMCITARSQQTQVDSMLALWEAKATSLPRETLYIQTSKDIYETGEDLWLKIYLMDAHSMGVSDISRTVFLEMTDCGAKDSVIWQEKYLVDSGFVAGHIYVGDKLRGGNYMIRAYTANSTYDGRATMAASRRVQIVESINKLSTNKIETQQTDSIRFDILPEGGNMITGLRSILAFKASNNSGVPVDFEGGIYSNGELITPIRSTHNGMGATRFRPQLGAKYEVRLNNGTVYPFPTIEPSGMVLNLSQRDSNYLYFTIQQSENSHPQTVTLRSQMRGVLYSIAQAKLTDSIRIRVPISEFGYQGIAEFTLLDSVFRPVAERLAYINEGKKLNITISPAKDQFTTREKASINIKVTDQHGMPVSANIGLSIYDQAFESSTENQNILSHCYLRSQVRGNIHNPSLYFDPSYTDHTQALDLLLLTQGWRRYVWNLDHSQQSSPMLTDHIMGQQSAKMPEKKGKRMTNPSADQLIKVFGPNGNSALTWTDSMGRFSIDTAVMRQLRGGYIYLKPMLSHQFKPELIINDPFELINDIRTSQIDFISTFEPSKARNQTVKIAAAFSLDSTVALDDVVVTTKGAKVFRDKFMGKLDSLLQLDLGPWVCEHGWLENYKDGYTHHHNPEYCPSPSDPGKRSKPVIGRTYTIMKAEYYPCNARGGWCFTPKDYRKVVYEGLDYTEDELLLRNNIWRTKGYYPVREFYRADQTDMAISTPDARNTLLWAPLITTNTAGEATVEFYCSDINQKFVVSVDATNKTGLLGSGRSEFRVVRSVTK